MTEGFSVKVDDGDVRNAIRRLRAIGKNPEPLNRNAAIWLTSRIKGEHFNRQVDEEGKPWPPMSALTRLLRRVGKGKGSPQLLRDTGRLRSSITYDVDSKGFRVGTNVRYAALQQFGSEGLPGGVIRPKRYRFLFIPAGKGKGGKKKHIRLRQARIPARPFIYANDEELAYIERIFLDGLDRAIFRRGGFN